MKESERNENNTSLCGIWLVDCCKFVSIFLEYLPADVCHIVSI